MEKIKPNMVSVLFGTTALEMYKYKAAASAGGATVAINSPAIISGGLPLLAGLSYRIGNSDVYLGANVRFLTSTASAKKHFSFGQAERERLLDVKSAAFFSGEAQLSYSLHRLLRQSWLDVQTGIGLGYQSRSFTDNGGEKGFMSGFRLSLNALQARILLHPNFFVFLNNAVVFAFLKPDSDTKVNITSTQYELSAGLGFSF